MALLAILVFEVYLYKFFSETNATKNGEARNERTELKAIERIWSDIRLPQSESDCADCYLFDDGSTARHLLPTRRRVNKSKERDNGTALASSISSFSSLHSTRFYFS